MILKAIRVTDIDSAAGRVPGAFELRYRHDELTAIAGMAFRCPCGCGQQSWLPLNGEGRPGPSWDWDGRAETPTLTPSVNNIGFACKWHGWLKNGEWRSC